MMIDSAMIFRCGSEEFQESPELALAEIILKQSDGPQ